MFKRIKMVAAIATVALAMLAVACGGDDDDDTDKPASSGDATAAFQQVPALGAAAPAGSKVFVGHDKDNKTSVGLIVFSDSKAVAYACDGNETWTWYSGTASGNDVNLTSADGAKFTAKISGSSVTGKANSDFTLETATGRGGVFRATITKGGTTETQGWIVENDNTVRGGIGATVAGKAVKLGASFTANQVADIQALPEFNEIKQAIPGFPTIPADVTVFSASGGGLCTRISLKLVEQSIGTTTVVPNTAANRARLGMLGRLGCKQEALFAVA